MYTRFVYSACNYGMEQSEKKEYELSFLLRSEEGISALQSVLSHFGYEVTSQSEIKRMVLAYPIKKETSALFGYVYFMAAPETVHNFMRELRLEPMVLRVLLINEPIKRTLQYGVEGTTPRDMTGKEEQQSTEKPADAVTNEDLEKKLEEILN